MGARAPTSPTSVTRTPHPGLRLGSGIPACELTLLVAEREEEGEDSWAQGQVELVVTGS